MRLILVCLIFALISAVSIAQDLPSRDDYERILIPIAPNRPTPGAYGSLWKAVLSLRNVGDQPSEVFHSFEIFHCIGIIILCEPGAPLQPQTTATTLDSQDLGTIFATIGAAERGPGALMHIERETASNIFFDLLLHELTTADQNQGTHLPVVRESELFDRPIELLNISTREMARARLRLYALPTPTLPWLRIEMYPLKGSELLGEVTLALTPDVRQNFPHYAEVVLDAPFFSPPASHDWVRLRISPLNSGFKYWGFVSLTNNETQLVSIITPQ